MVEKSDYTRPELTVYGSIEELTNDLGGAGSDGPLGSQLA
jgi:hypothetical protein